MKKIGIFGGTFDPIHNGHIYKAEEALAKLNLDELIWVVAGNPWMKSREPLSAAKHRLEMVNIAIQGKAKMKLTDIEVNRKGPTYTIDTLKDLTNRNPGDELVLLVGSDLIQEFDQWKYPDEILSLSKLAVFTRKTTVKDTWKMTDFYKTKGHKLEVLCGPIIDISSTAIRDRVISKASISEYVPKAIEKYIIENKLYLG
ncbi:MAG: nicotinate-nucleotide adenylyltransferase [Nisaea sp.]|nr:nicotinate-nucleotide adenylyltransferase [SAR202 cluster bacterium]MCH2631116.1 nicotinate-nucleotide adenylyltransferase [Nisaea sp.]MCH2657057.1 nicotinate-nucleotide adenylyltransferase [Dehalococcoidia bacterium]|tara:strand:+ start:15350 stop:15949 length:600 start_codon:yes stop_codon:yes gene_type:complete